MRALLIDLLADEALDARELAAEQLGRRAVHGRIPGFGNHAMADEQRLPVVDGECLVFVVDGFTARAERVDLVRQLGDGAAARARVQKSPSPAAQP